MNIRDRINPDVAAMPPSGIRKFFDIVSEMKDAVSLSVGEPDFDTPWNISEAAIYSLEQNRTHYTSNAGLIQLRELICRYYAERFNVGYQPEQCIVTVGASEGIDLAMRALIVPGDEVIIPAPSYVSYSPCVMLAGGVPVPVPTTAAQMCKVQPDTIKELITPRTKALILPYPNNPTGAILTREELAEIAAVLEDTNVVLICDEIYAELTYGHHHTSIAEFPSMYDRTIVINGFSKAFAMTGWRLGYLLAPKELITPMLKIHQFVIMCASTVGQFAGIEALKSGFEDQFAAVERMTREYDRRRRVVVHGLAELGIPCFDPEGAFYAFPDITASGLSSEVFCERLLREQGVAIVPGTAFGESGEGYARLSYAASLENIHLALNKIKMFLQSL